MTDALFSPYKLKNFTLKNRLGVAPMTRISGGDDCIPRQDVLDFLVTRAKNDAALIYTEAIVTDYESAQGYPGQARMTTQPQIDAWKKVTDAIREQGAVSICQMFHCGRMAWKAINPAGRVIAPSPVPPAQDNPFTEGPYEVPDEMSSFDMTHVINGFKETARGAMAAGFDGVEIHAAHGYLLNQFLSTYSNRRSDEYGGSMENRFRFVRQVTEAVRDVVPQDRLLIVRVSNWGIADMDVSLFENKEEWQEMIRLFDAQPIDAISVSTYDYSMDAFNTGHTMAALTRQVTSLPLMICGKIHDRNSAADALKDADIVLSGKTSLLNPDWVEDFRAGKELPAHRSEDANVAYTPTPLP